MDHSFVFRSRLSTAVAQVTNVIHDPVGKHRRHVVDDDSYIGRVVSLLECVSIDPTNSERPYRLVSGLNQKECLCSDLLASYSSFHVFMDRDHIAEVASDIERRCTADCASPGLTIPTAVRLELDLYVRGTGNVVDDGISSVSHDASDLSRFS